MPGVRLDVEDPQDFLATTVGVHILEATQQQATALGRGELIERPEFFDLLAGTRRVRERLAAGTSAEDIVDAWANEVEAFRQLRSQYLLYPS